MSRTLVYELPIKHSDSLQIGKWATSEQNGGVTTVEHVGYIDLVLPDRYVSFRKVLIDERGALLSSSE